MSHSTAIEMKANEKTPFYKEYHSLDSVAKQDRILPSPSIPVNRSKTICHRILFAGAIFVLVLSFIGILFVALPLNDSERFPVLLMVTGDRIQFKSSDSNMFVRVHEQRGHENPSTSMVLDQTIPWTRGSTFEIESTGECFILRSATGKYVRIDDVGDVHVDSTESFGATHLVAVISSSNTFGINPTNVGNQGNIGTNKKNNCTMIGRHQLSECAGVENIGSSQSSKGSLHSIPLSSIHLKVCQKNQWLQEVTYEAVTNDVTVPEVSLLPNTFHPLSLVHSFHSPTTRSTLSHPSMLLLFQTQTEPFPSTSQYREPTAAPYAFHGYLKPSARPSFSPHAGPEMDDEVYDDDYYSGNDDARRLASSPSSSDLLPQDADYAMSASSINGDGKLANGNIAATTLFPVMSVMDTIRLRGKRTIISSSTKGDDSKSPSSSSPPPSSFHTSLVPHVRLSTVQVQENSPTTRLLRWWLRWWHGQVHSENQDKVNNLQLGHQYYIAKQQLQQPYSKAAAPSSDNHSSSSSSSNGNTLNQLVSTFHVTSQQTIRGVNLGGWFVPEVSVA